MNLKILIVDDNHSFVDLLKMKLDQYPFNFDTVFRYEQAENKIVENGAFFSRDLVEEIKNTTEQLEEWHKRGQTKPYPKISKKLLSLEEVTNSEGYFLMIVENKAERVPKGIGFIQNILSLNPDFTFNDFMLFMDDLDQFAQEARERKIPVFQKDIRNEKIYEFVGNKLEDIRDKVSEVAELFRRFKQIKNKFENEVSKEKSPQPKSNKKQKGSSKSAAVGKETKKSASTPTKSKKPRAAASAPVKRKGGGKKDV